MASSGGRAFSSPGEKGIKIEIEEAEPMIGLKEIFLTFCDCHDPCEHLSPRWSPVSSQYGRAFKRITFTAFFSFCLRLILNLELLRSAPLFWGLLLSSFIFSLLLLLFLELNGLLLLLFVELLLFLVDVEDTDRLLLDLPLLLLLFLLLLLEALLLRLLLLSLAFLLQLLLIGLLLLLSLLPLLLLFLGLLLFLSLFTLLLLLLLPFSDLLRPLPFSFSSLFFNRISLRSS